MSSDLQATIATYRDQLMAGDDAAAQALAQAYLPVWLAVRAQVDQLTKQISEMQQLGVDVTEIQSTLLQRNSLQELTDMIRREVSTFSDYAQSVTAGHQQQALTAGVRDAQELLDATVPEGVSWTFGRVPPSVLYQQIGATQPGSPLNDLFSSFGDEAAKGAKAALLTGLATGINPRQIATGVRDALNVPLWRAQTITRTESIRAYKSATLANYQANDDVVDAYVWISDLSTSACGECLALNGQEFPLDETPDSHPNCRCSIAPVTKSWGDILGLDTLDEAGNIPEEPIAYVPQPAQARQLGQVERMDYQYLKANEARYQREVTDYGAEVAKADTPAGHRYTLNYAQLRDAAQAQLDVLAQFERRRKALQEYRKHLRSEKKAAIERFQQRLASALPTWMGQRFTVESGADWFARQSPEEQAQALGPAKYALYATGKLELADLIGYSYSPEWGGMRYEKSLKELGFTADDVARAQAELAKHGPITRKIPPEPQPVHEPLPHAPEQEPAMPVIPIPGRDALLGTQQ